MIDLPNTSWMWIPDWEKADHSVCYLVYFRKKILLEKIPESLKLQISADSRYKLYVNGKLAELGPSKGDRQIWYLDEVDACSVSSGWGKCSGSGGSALSAGLS